LNSLENQKGDTGRRERRLWRFAGNTFDEGQWALHVSGAPVALESKPLEILLELLRHAGEAVTKDELLEAVWPGVTVVDGSLATAVSKLRKALGDEAQSLIVTIPRIGYRLDAGVSVIGTDASRPRPLGLSVGDSVPRRDQWQLIRRLGTGQMSDVWLAVHRETGERRVFKFAEDAAGLGRLKREVTLSRLLQQNLGTRPDLARVLEWNFESSPFYLESEYGGPDLESWAEEQGGLGTVPLAVRVALTAQMAHAVAAAHAVGVLHKDLKPANVLVAGKDGDWQIRIADFGSGWVLDSTRLEALRITSLASTQETGLPSESRTGTPLYLAPEILGGHLPTVAADIYALGIILYQMIAGDLRKPLTAGWESEIADPLLRKDIALAAAGDPGRRLDSAAELAARLDSLEVRRIARLKAQSAEVRAHEIERAVERTRARRPWVIAVAVALVLGIGASLTLYFEAARERDVALRQTEIAQSVNQFLSFDFLTRTNPYRSGKSDETLLDAVKLAAPDISRRFSHEPQIAARLHQALARALDKRSDWPDARRQYDRAAALYARAEGANSPDTIILWLQRAMMEARCFEGGSLARAKRIVAEQETHIAKMRKPDGKVAIWLASAKGMVALIGNNLDAATGHFRTAIEAAKSVPTFDTAARLDLTQRLAFTLFRAGKSKEAETLFRALIPGYADAEGPDSAAVLQTRLNLTQTLMQQGKHVQVIMEANALYPRLVATLGPDHEMTMQLLATRAQSESSIEHFGDAIKDDLMLYNLALGKQGPASFFAIASLSDAATAQCRSGHIADGLRNVQRAYTVSQKAFGDNAALTQGTAFTWADCLIHAARYDEAEKHLAGIDPHKVARLAADAYWGANLNLARAQIAYTQRDYVQMRKELAQAAPAFARPAAENYQKRVYARLVAEAGTMSAAR